MKPRISKVIKTSILFLFIILLFHQSQAQIQSGEVIYKAKEIKSPFLILEEKNKDDPDMSNLFASFDRKVKSTLPYLEFTLKFNREKAIYNSRDFIESDNPKLDIDFTKGIVRGRGVFYNNLLDDLYLNQFKNSSGKSIIIKDNFNSVSWEIQNETKEILGYKVQKAVAEVQLDYHKTGQVIVWFAPKLPFQHGPIGYGNLPGLILELEIGGYSHYADEIKLNKKSIKISKPTKGELITRKEYNKKTEQKAKTMFSN